MQFSGGKIRPKNGATEKMKKRPGAVAIMMQNTKNQPYMTIQCLWKPVQKPEKNGLFWTEKRLNIAWDGVFWEKSEFFYKNVSHVPNEVPRV